jgi:predicted nucleotide-binding protein
MPDRIRVYELALQLGLTADQTLDVCRSLGIPAKSTSSSVHDNDIERVESLARLFLARGDHENEAAPTMPGAPTVFLVHGHNERYRAEVARVLERCVEAALVILHEQRNRGRTIIEKFEDYASASQFAVVLLTADDVGRAKTSSADLQDRPRQNVVLELGYFIGRLGRERVVVMLEKGVEQPSDILGLVYIELDAAGAWHYKLLRELRDAGFAADLNRAP